MAIVSGTKIVDDGSLIFHYDMGNLNSYKGPPCENLVPSGMRTCSANFTRQLWHVEPFFYETTTDKGRTDVKRIWCNPTKTGAQPYADFGFQASRSGGTQIGDVYQVSFDYKHIVNSTQIEITVYANGYKIPDATDVGTVNNTTNTSLGNGWYRKSFNVTVTAAGNTHWRFGFASNNYYVEKLVDNFQIIYAGVDSSFVDGTRSNTEAIIDLTGNRIVTSSNITYNSDNTFEFGPRTDAASLIIDDPAYPTSWNDPFSFEIWHYVPTGADWEDTLTFGDSSATCLIGRGSFSGSHGIGRSDTNLFVNIVRTDSGLVSTNFTGDYDTWYHLVGTYDGTNNRLYVNGELKSTAAVTISGVPDTGNVRIGGNLAFGGFNGGYAEGKTPIARMYSKALTAAEVKQNFNASRTRFGI